MAGINLSKHSLDGLQGPEHVGVTKSHEEARARFAEAAVGDVGTGAVEVIDAELFVAVELKRVRWSEEGAWENVVDGHVVDT